MEERPGGGISLAQLGNGIWTFFVWKTLSALWTLAYLVFAVVWALPRFAQATAIAGDMQAGYREELAIAAAELLITVVGLVLILRRHRLTRWYWIVVLVLHCMARLSEAVLGPEPLWPAAFLITGIAWLAYWAFARRTRELAFGAYWIRPT